MAGTGDRGRQTGQKCAGWGRGENEWARPGSTGSAGLAPESLAGAWPGGQTGRAERPALMLRKRHVE